MHNVISFCWLIALLATAAATSLAVAKLYSDPSPSNRTYRDIAGYP